MTRWMRSPRIPAALRHWINTLRAALQEWSRPHTEDFARRALLTRIERRRSVVPQLERLEEIEAPVSLITPTVPLGAVGHVAEASNQAPMPIPHANDNGSVEALPSDRDMARADSLFSQPAASSNLSELRSFVTGADQFSLAEETTRRSGLIAPAIDPLSQGGNGTKHGGQVPTAPAVNHASSAPWILAAMLAGAGQGFGGVSTPAALGGGSPSGGGGGGGAANQLAALGIQGAFDNHAPTAPAGHQAAPMHAATTSAVTHTAMAAPAHSLTAGVSPNVGITDTYTWSPTDPSLNASKPQDWKKNNVQQDATGTLPTANDQVNFDGNVSNANINWDQKFTINTMVLGPGTTAYTGTQMIAANATVELTGNNPNSQSLNTSQPDSVLHVNFGTNSTFQIDSNAVITNMNLDGVPSGTFFLQGGMSTIGLDNYTDLIGANFKIGGGAGLRDYGYCPLQFTNSNLALVVLGRLEVDYGTGSGLLLIKPSTKLTTGCYVDVNGGSLYYEGNTGVIDTFAVPVLVENAGTFAVTGYNGAQGGELITQTDGTVDQTGSYSVMMNNAGSSVQLSNGSTLECDDGYVQNNGTLKTMDATISVLRVGSDGSGTAYISGGSVIIDASSDPDVGELDINCGNLNFGAATLVVGIMGSYSGYSDLLKVNGNMLIDTKLSTLSVDVSGTAQLNSSWTIIKANNQLNQFPNTNDQQTGLHDGPDPLNPKQYLVTK